MNFGPIRFIPGENRGKFPNCNSIYIEKAGLLIDPASNRDTIRRIRDREGIEIVCLTHWHEDHFMHLDLLDNVPLWTSEKDAEPLAGMDIFLDWYGIGKPDGKELREIIRPRLEKQFHFKPRIPDRFLKDGEIIDLGNVTLEVILTPGHSPGHLAFFFREPEVLFLGDYNLDTFGPWYGDPYSSLEQTIDSINRLRKVPAKTWIAGHGKGIIEEAPEKRWDFYLGAIQRRENELMDFLAISRSLDEIVERWIVLGKPMEPLIYYKFGEKAHMLKHLDRLVDKGLVQCQNERYRRV
ncbi:MBL fold metallo-hydrolase [bacterium]|nr:MBL fold metallo-hydrolase [bacterium]